MEEIPFYNGDEFIGKMFVRLEDIIIRQHQYISTYTPEQVEYLRAKYRAAVAEARPQGYTVLSIYYGDRADNGDMVDRYVFVKDGQFIFRTADGLRSRKFRRHVPDDGLPVYVVEEENGGKSPHE